MDAFVIRTDGGARGNPGPAATGFVIENSKGQVLTELGEYIGEKTNNEAEYRAPIAGLKKLKTLIGKDKAKKARVAVVSDSQLMVRQMNGQYKIENPNIQKFFLELWNIKLDFKEVSFTAVPREQNKGADRMVNEALDAQGKAKQLF
jgi:ribonuclease HI